MVQYGTICIMLYCIILYHIILYYFILYYIILHCGSAASACYRHCSGQSAARAATYRIFSLPGPRLRHPWGFPRLGLVRLVLWMLGFPPSIFIHFHLFSYVFTHAHNCSYLSILSKTKLITDSVKSKTDEHE